MEEVAGVSMKKPEIKNPGLKILALALAVLLWFYVGIEKNPFETRYFQVPVTYEHLDEEMSVNSPTKQVSITVRARTNQFESLTAGDFTASVDLSKVRVGDNTVPVNVKSPGHVQVTKVSPGEIVVTAERLDGKRFPVQVQEIGALPNGEKVKSYQAQPGDVFVAGDPGVLKNVAKAVVQVQLGDIYESGVLDLPVVLLDAKGQVLHLPGVAVKPRSVNLTITLNKDAREKTVAVVPTVNGKAADGYVLTAAKAEPETITVSGPADILADVDQVTTETIDITNMQNNRQVTVSLKLPQGVRAAGKGDIRVNLSFAKKKEASLEAEIPIEIQQLSTGLNAELNQSMVRVRYMPIGGSTQVYAVVDASGLGVGQHRVDVNAYTSDGSVVEQVVPQQVTVTIT